MKTRESADEEQLKILWRGVGEWNAWRRKHPHPVEVPHLLGANLRGWELNGINLSGAKLGGAKLMWAQLLEADLSGADLSGADLSGANLKGANLEWAHLNGAYLRETYFSQANLTRANLSDADLREANLIGAVLDSALLGGANLRGASLRGTNLFKAHFNYTVLSCIDLRGVKELESIQHDSPSVLGVDVLHGSQGQLPTVFLKGCGLSDWEIEAAKLHNPKLSEHERTSITYEMLRIQGHQPIQLNPLFISYSSADAPFVENLEPHFDKLGIRYWRDVRDLKAGRLEAQIDRAIRLNPTVLLVLSERSVESDWVEWEVAQARKLEKQIGRDVFCPVALDDAWKTCSWPGVLRRQIEGYHILDFSAWKDAAAFERQFGKLLEGLELFYRPKE